MNINQWKNIINFIELTKYPLLTCPHCLKVELSIDETSIQKRSILKHTLAENSRKFKSEKAANRAEHKEQIAQITQGDGFWVKLIAVAGSSIMNLMEPINGKQFLFNSFFTCNNCKQHVTATGILIEPIKFTEQSMMNSPIIKVEHFSPTIPMFPLSIHIPENIRVELLDAFKHFHFDTLSAASKLRRAIEQFCINMKAKGKDLHQRICNLKQRYPEEAQYLEVLKLVGNEGAHNHDVTEIDLLHAFEIVQFVLDVYNRKARYKATLDNYELLTSKFGKDKSGKDNTQLRLPKSIDDKEIKSVKQ